MQPGDFRALTVEENSTQQFRSKGRIPPPIQCYFVFLFDLIPRMGEPLGEVAIVGEKNEAFGLRVKTADIEEPGKFFGQKIEDCIAGVSIFSRRDEARRLVQQDGEQWFGTNKLTIHFHVVARTRLCAEVSANAPIDRDAASGDQLIAMPSRANSSRG